MKFLELKKICKCNSKWFTLASFQKSVTVDNLRASIKDQFLWWCAAGFWWYTYYMAGGAACFISLGLPGAFLNYGQRRKVNKVSNFQHFFGTNNQHSRTSVCGEIWRNAADCILWDASARRSAAAEKNSWRTTSEKITAASQAQRTAVKHKIRESWNVSSDEFTSPK